MRMRILPSFAGLCVLAPWRQTNYFERRSSRGGAKHRKGKLWRYQHHYFSARMPGFQITNRFGSVG